MRRFNTIVDFLSKFTKEQQDFISFMLLEYLKSDAFTWNEDELSDFLNFLDAEYLSKIEPNFNTFI